MDITISQLRTQADESWGIFSAKRVPRFAVHCGIKFSSEELAAIDKKKLHNYVVATFLRSETAWRGDPELMPEDRAFTIKSIIQSNGFLKDFATPAQAAQWEQALREKILPNLKEVIMGEPQSQSFRL